MRTFAIAVCLLGLGARADAQTVVAPTAAEKYQAEKKSPALALTLEAVSPIAGAGAFYAHDWDRGLTLAITSALAAGAGVGSAFWLIHLDHQQESGFNRAVQDVEQGAAITILVTAAIVYVVARVSGLVLAPEATDAFNDQLRGELGAPAEPIVSARPQAPRPVAGLQF